LIEVRKERIRKTEIKSIYLRRKIKNIIYTEQILKQKELKTSI